MKSILIVTEAFDVGGLETHIKGEIISLTHAGCRVHLATGLRFNSLLLPQEVASVTNNFSLGPEATLADFINSVDGLRRLIREHAIKYVHAHPFTSVLPSLIAAELEGVPYALTLHGPASLGNYYGPLYDFIFTSVVLPNAGLVVAVSREVAELASPYLKKGEALILPNGVDVSAFASVSASAEYDKRWLVVSRLDSFKVVGIADFIRKAKLAGLPGVLLVGDGSAKEELQQRLNRDGITDFVEFLGMSVDVPRLMQVAGGVAGMGRVVLEGLASRKPVCLIGYDGVKGIIDQKLLAVASQANFSGRNLKNIDSKSFCKQLAHLSKFKFTSLYKIVEKRFLEPSLWESFFENLKTIEPQTSTLLSDGYRSLVASDVNKTALLLQSTVLLEHLGRLAHSPKYSEPSLIASFLYHRDRFMDMKFNQAVAERDGRIGSLNLTVIERDEQIASHNQTVFERDGQIASLNQTVFERDGQIASLNQTVIERDEQIASHNQTVFERDGQIASLNQTVIERDEQIASHNQTVFERDGQIASLNQTVIERDEQIASLNQTVFERDGQIASLNQAVIERDEQIASHNQTVFERDGQIASLNQAVVERDGQIARLNQAMAERNGQIASLNVISHSQGAEILKLKSSTSWILTRPLRFMKLFFQNPKKSAYDLVKFVYWRLPPPIRQALQGPRHKFVRWVRGFPVPPPYNRELDNECTSDLSWDDFNTKVLSRRSEFKGIFIQESTIPWNAPLYQRPQHIACAFGRLGYLVLYKTVNWSDDTINGVREVDQNVWTTTCSQVDAIEGAVCSFYSTDFTIRPQMISKRRGIQKIIYEYIDHIDPKISGDAENIRRLVALKDFAFGGGADYIVASARKLEAEVVEAVGRDKVILAQNGVDIRHYRNPIHQSTPLPENLVLFKNKYFNIVGYFGALAPWLWYEAISELVEARPDLGFVFIGPDYYGSVEKLPKAENVQYLGTVDYKVLPAYAREFDVCFIPFAPGEIAKTTSPLKLFEYFALEKPVVVTSEMLECVAFKEVFSGDSANALSQAIDAAVQVKNDSDFKKRLAKLAEENDWETRAKAMELIFQCNLYEGIAKTFGVSLQFVRLYFMRQQGLGRFHKDSWEALYQALDPLQKLHVEFAMTTVIRGREIARLLDNNSCISYKRRYLDVGTGFGGFLRAFKDFGFSEVVGIELQAHLAEYAKANIAGIESAQVLNVDFEEADCSGLGKFDLITCNDVIEHVKQPAKVIQKMTALVTESGCISLKVPNKDSVSFVKSDGHFQLFGITQLSKEDAATYYSEALGLSKDNYLFEMGESYELEWYLEKMGENGMDLHIIDTHLTGEISDMPNIISDLNSTYENWCKHEKPKFSDSVSKTVQSVMISYIFKLENDFNSLDDEVSKEGFRNKYLSSFWTIVALK